MASTSSANSLFQAVPVVYRNLEKAIRRIYGRAR